MSVHSVASSFCSYPSSHEHSYVPAELLHFVLLASLHGFSVALHSSMSVHSFASSFCSYPSSHEHSYVPAELLHFVLLASLQGFSLALHSSMSVQSLPSPVKPALHSHT